MGVAVAVGTELYGVWFLLACASLGAIIIGIGQDL